MRKTRYAVPGVLTALILGACSITACSPDESADSAGTSANSAPGVEGPAAEVDEHSDATGVEGSLGSGEINEALATLDTLEVKGRAPKTGYSRDEFGQRWRDVDHNGCDTRNDILARDLHDISTTGNCIVTSGVLDDPYTATTINFTRGQGTSEAVQIDHLVALSDAWQKGAQQLTPERREQFANDPANLLAVDGPANMQKSDGDAATWLPKNKAFRCTYVSRQIGVKASYGLWVTNAEKDAMRTVLSSCGGDLPGGAGSVAPPLPTDAAVAVAEDPETFPAGGAGDVYFPNCSAARAAGAAPLFAGQPGYRVDMDRDGDGIACE